MKPARKHNRLPQFDYRQERLYYVTVCVKDMACVFGEVRAEQMCLNAYGSVVEKQWQWLAEQYTYVVSHAFVVMPNHVHGILEIKQVAEEADLATAADTLSQGFPSAKAPKIKSLSELIGAFKTTSSKLIKQAGLPDFAWHRSFYDHIIRDERGYEKIKDYIDTNPARWHEDRYRPGKE
ncbi:transposase [Rufibacter roseus]|uniref:Transposase n=1 Tax=Rufibacter roseus TaxID=1567108 RepID=A0ABW2DJW6_9BACT|nr:transposase [Rufibacter roseus]